MIMCQRDELHMTQLLTETHTLMTYFSCSSLVAMYRMRNITLLDILIYVEALAMT